VNFYWQVAFDAGSLIRCHLAICHKGSWERETAQTHCIFIRLGDSVISHILNAMRAVTVCSSITFKMEIIWGWIQWTSLPLNLRLKLFCLQACCW